MGRENLILILVKDVESRLKGKHFSSLKDLVIACMKEAKDHWLVTDTDEQFRGSLGAALLLANAEQKCQLEIEIECLQALVTGNLGHFDLPEDFEPIGLIPLWREIKETK